MACTIALVWVDDFMQLVQTGGMKMDSFLGEFILLFLLWSFGRRVRGRILYMTLLKERGDQLEREQQAEAERAVTVERARIARELHDIVAHQVSMMTVQAGAAKTVARTDLDAAINAMEAVEGAGRQALREMRQLLSLLRPEQDSTNLAPQPGPGRYSGYDQPIASGRHEYHSIPTGPAGGFAQAPGIGLLSDCSGIPHQCAETCRGQSQGSGDP